MLKSKFRPPACASTLDGILCAQPAFACPALAKRAQCQEAHSPGQAGLAAAICAANRT